MPSRQNAARIDPAVWELHRTEVHTHYILELVRMLLCEGANPNAPKEAAKGGSIDLIHIALDVGANANGPPSMIIPGGTVFQAAVLARHNGIELVKILIEAGADINACAGKRTALQAAVLGGNIGLVRALLDAGADVNASRGSRVTHYKKQ